MKNKSSVIGTFDGVSGDSTMNNNEMLLSKELWEKAKQDLIKNQRRDEIKREFCKNNGIKLLEIRYDEQKNTKEILKKELNLL